MNTQKYRYYQVMFYSGAIFNWAAAIVWLAAFEEMYRFMGGGAVPQTPLFELFLHLTSTIIFLFGGVYYSIARNPNSATGRSLAITGMIGKLLFFYFFTRYAVAGHTPWPLAGLVTIDFLYAVLFFEYVRYQSVHE